jgi:hypothetical protein
MVSNWYDTLGGGVGTIANWILCYLLGMRGWALLVGGIVLWFPIVMLCVFLLDRIVPPPLEAYKPRGKLNS